MKVFNFIICILSLFFLIEVDSHRLLFKSKGRSKKLSFESQISAEDPICKGIYEIGLKYNANPDLPKSKASDFEKKSLQIFTTIKLDEQIGTFDFNAFIEGTLENKQYSALVNFFYDNEFPPKYNWFDLKGCCLKLTKYQGKNVFDDICFSMIYGFITFRYFTMVVYVERAFKEAIENLEYSVGEIPLSPEERARRMKLKMERNEDISISVSVWKAEHPKWSTKGNKKTPLSEDNNDFLDTCYFNTEGDYVFNLKKHLEKSCAISFFIPVKCVESVRICPFFYDNKFEKFLPDAKKKEDENPGSKTKNFMNDPNYFSFHCLKDGYFLVCTSKEHLKNSVSQEIKSSDKESTAIIKAKNTVTQDIRNIALRILYFGSVTATSDLDFTTVTFQASNAVQNYNLQRAIVENFNHRYQNDMAIKMKIKNGDTFECYNGKAKCFSTGRCLDTNAYLMGFMEGKFNNRQFTGIPEVDGVFNSLEGDQPKILRDESFLISVALGMTALSDFWEVMEEYKVADTMRIEGKVDFREGILVNFKSQKISDSQFADAAIPLYQALEKIENEGRKANNIEVYSVDLKEEDAINAAKEIAETINTFARKVGEYMNQVKTVKHNAYKEIYMERAADNIFLEQVKLNECYTLLTLVAIEEITHIRPDFEVALQKYKEFSINVGVSLMCANEAYFNDGSIKYQIAAEKKSPPPCNTYLEASYMIMGYALLHYFEGYPKVQGPKTIDGEEPQGYALFDHGDSLLKLAKYYVRVIDTVVSECTLFQQDYASKIFLTDFTKNGFIDDDAANLGETGQNYQGPTIDPNIHRDPHRQEFYNTIDNMRVLNVFSKLAMSLKKTYGQTPMILYPKVIKLEENVLVAFMKGYVKYDVKKSVIPIAKVANYILTIMTYNYIVSQNIWSSFDKIKTKQVVEKAVKNKVSQGNLTPNNGKQNTTPQTGTKKGGNNLKARKLIFKNDEDSVEKGISDLEEYSSGLKNSSIGSLLREHMKKMKMFDSSDLFGEENK